MSLTAGTRLGPYEITGPLGAGGMGEVYRARDTKLHRDVAIKSLHSAVAGDHERIARFEREAQLLASLHHPNIAGIYGLEQSQGATYLVLEFVDGRPLDAVLQTDGPLAPGDAIKMARQIADAIAAAHEKGIIHRDLKPGNVMVTADGHVKVLDFGLGKSIDDGRSSDGGRGFSPGDANSPTITLGATQAGIILGTAGYMSPEQAKGRVADRRSDVWSFGCLLFEMLSGSRAFDGEDITDTIAAIVRGEPNWKALPASTPPGLRTLIDRCLAKDRAERLADMAVVRYALDERSIADSDARLRTGAPARSNQSLFLGIAIGAAIAGLAVVAWISTRTSPTGSADSLARLSLAARIPEGVAYRAGNSRPALALSPDGRTIAFRGESNKGPAIYLRQLGQFDTVKVAGSEGGDSPFFSPTGDWIAFRSGPALKKLPIGGGVAVPICEVGGLRGAVWLADDTIVYAPSATGGLWRVPAQGGTPGELTKLDASKREKTHRTAIGLPGGKAIVFVIGSDDIDSYNQARIVALTLETGKQTELVTGGYAPIYSDTGHLLYVRDRAVFAVPFDPVTLSVGSTPVQVLNDVATQPNYGTAEYAIAATGLLIYATGGDQFDRRTVVWMDRQGNMQPMPVAEGPYYQIHMSPDGRRLSLVKEGANNTLMTYDIERNQMTRATFRLDAEDGVWAGDTRLTYWGGQDVRLITADGSNIDEVLIDAATVAGRGIHPRSWSADGQKLDVTIITPGKGRDVFVYSRGDKKFTMIASTRYDEQAMGLTPDGNWVALLSDESDRSELFVRAADGTGRKYPVSNDGGYFSQWTQHGRELIYFGGKGLMSASFTPGPVPVIGTPKLLIDGAKLDNILDFDPAPDGKRFALLLDKPRPSLPDIRVVTNWTQELLKIRR